MYYGHDPRAVDDYPWRDVEAYLIMLPHLKQQIGGPFG